MRLGVSVNGEDVEKHEIAETPKNFEEGMGLFREILLGLTEGKPIEKSAGGIRSLDPSKEKILPDFRLPDWSGKPLRETLSEITKAEVYLENDSALVGLGEALKGAGKDFNIVAFLTISSGVGGARIVNRKIEENKSGFEPGRQIVDIDWSIFPDLKSLQETEGLGQLEAYISGTSFERRFNKKPSQVLDESVWDQSAWILAIALVNLIAFWSPEIVVLGGGMMGSPGISIDSVRLHLTKISKVLPGVPEIRKAELGDLGGLYGALGYLKSSVN